MSTLNDDRLVLQKGRKNTLKDAEVGKRDQIPEKLLTKLEEMNIGAKIADLWAHGNANRQEWLDRQEKYLSSWDEHLESTASGPFLGSSSLHIPMPLIVAKTVHARFLQALLGIEPYFTTKSRTAASIDRSRMVQDVMAYTLKDWINCYDGIDDVADEWLWHWITAGCGILKVRWEVQYERFLDIVKDIEQSVETVVDPETGAESTVPAARIVEKEQMVTKVKSRGPVAETRMAEDVLIIGGKGDPQKADAVIDSYHLSASEIWTCVDSKAFKRDAAEAVINGGSDRKEDMVTTSIKQTRATNAGIAMLDTNSELDKYHILEAYLRLDVDGSGINTDVVVWAHPRSRKILRATYLHRINKSGERPFFKIDFLKRPGQDYGTGLIEMLYPLSKEMDAIHNMRIDFGMLATMPFGFYRPSSSIEPETLQLRPGDLIPLDDPQRDVYFPNLGNRTSFGMQEEMALQSMVERLTGINDMSLGVLTGAQGATRTATGARALLGESNANLDVYLRRMQRGWRRFLKYLLHMLQQRIPEGLSFRVTGEAGSDYWAQIRSRDDLAGDFDFEISGNSSNSNPAIQEEVATNILQLVQNPLLIQLGVVTPANVFEAVKNYLKAKGVKDFAKYVQQPPDYQYTPTPQEEADRILRGMATPVVPNMDHAGFLAYFEEIWNTDELLGQFDQESTQALYVQAEKHKQMMQAIEQMRAQQANANQMRSNAEVSGAQQAPPGMSAMAGTGDPNAA